MWEQSETRLVTPVHSPSSLGVEPDVNKNPLPGALAASALFALAACSSGSSSSITQVPQPPSATSVAQQLGLTAFTDCGPAPLGGVADSGIGYKDSVRYGVDTFPSQDIRDTWLKSAAHLGVVPLWEGTTWAAYKTATQAVKGCT